MIDPIPGQTQLFSVEATVPKGLPPGKIPQYEDVVLTEEQIEEAKREWPSRPVYKRDNSGQKVRGPHGKYIVAYTVPMTEAEQIRNMKCRVLNKMRHEVMLDPVSGRRAFGGVQPGAGPKKRADESLVEAADNRIDELIDAAFSSVTPGNGNTNEVRHKSAMNIIKVAQNLKKIQMTDKELDKASGEELANLAAEILAQAVRDGKLDKDAFDLPPADVIEIEP